MSKAVLSFTATQTDPYDLQRLFLKPSPRLLYSKIAVFYKTEEKQVLLMIIFHRVMGCKSDIFGFGTSNMISRKDIMPVLASFKNLDIFSLSATLTHNGSSVEGPYLCQRRRLFYDIKLYEKAAFLTDPQGQIRILKFINELE